MPKKGSNLRATDLRIDHTAQMRMVEKAGVGDWNHPGDSIDEQDEDVGLGQIMDLAAKLTKILSWVSDGRVGGTMDQRTWAMLYVLRPDLIEGETMRAYARRRGVSWSRVNSFVREFRSLFPGVQFKPGSRVENREAGAATPPEGISLRRAPK